MWILLTILSVFVIAIVNYIDSHLTEDNPAKKDVETTRDPHTEVGGLMLISTLMSFLGAFVSFLILGGDVPTKEIGVVFSLASSIPFAATFASSFYLIRIYPVYQVVPLFQLSSIWLLIVEVALGVPISVPQIIAVLILFGGSYLLDVGKIEWKIPGKLLSRMIPVSVAWALGFYFVRIASDTIPGTAISFWQFLAIGCIGILLLLFVKKYRDGLKIRVKEQGKKFLGLSLVNESLSQGSYYLGNLAIAIAPAAAFVNALGGLQGVFVILVFLGLGKKVTVNRVQIMALSFIAFGVFLIERF